MATLQFTEQLIKGKIAEIIFEMMFRQMSHRITHFGYEYTAGEFIREEIQHIEENKAVLQEIKHSPDFIVTTPQNHIHFVEVKFQSELRPNLLLKMAEKTAIRWSQAWYFVATKKGFFFAPCQQVIRENGNIAPLKTEHISAEVQADYLELLHKYLPRANPH